MLFSGDTLFPGGPGNTKFEGASFPQIIQSIDRRLFTLPGDTLVLPGHGLDTTIDTERPTPRVGRPRLVARAALSSPAAMHPSTVTPDDAHFASCVTRAVASGPTPSRGCTCRPFPW